MPAVGKKTTQILLDSDTVLEAHRVLSGGQSNVSLSLKMADGEEVVLPPAVEKVLLQTLTSLSKGVTTTISRIPDELTSTVAAELLEVSRPTLMKWVEQGMLPSFRVGSHTRFYRHEVMRFKKQREVERREAFAQLRELDKEWDFGE